MSNINSFLKSDRKSQNMRGAVMLRRLRKQQRGVEPRITALPDHELDRALERAAETYNLSPRSGLKKFLNALIAEKDRRAVRRAIRRR